MTHPLCYGGGVMKNKSFKSKRLGSRQGNELTEQQKRALRAALRIILYRGAFPIENFLDGLRRHRFSRQSGLQRLRDQVLS